MGLEANFDNLDDLNESWPLNTDPVSEGAAQLRGVKTAIHGNINGSGTETWLLSGGEQSLIAGANGAAVRGHGVPGQTLLELVDDADDPQVGLHADQLGGLFHVTMQNKLLKFSLDGINAGDAAVTLIYADPDAQVNLYSGGVPRLGTTGIGGQVLGSAFQVNNAGADELTYHRLRTSVGGFQMQVAETSAQMSLQQISSAGTVQKAVLNASRDGALQLFNNGLLALTTTPQGITTDSQTDETAYVQIRNISQARSARVGFNNTDNLDLRNLATGGGVRLLNSGNVLMVEAKSAAEVGLYNDGGLALQTTGRGLDVLDSDASGTPTIGLRLANTTSVGQVLATATQMIIRAGAGGSMNLQDNNGTNVLNSTVGGAVSLLAAGVICFSTYTATNRANFNTGGSVRDAGGTDRPIGFNTLPRTDINTANYVPAAADNGEKLRIGGSGSILLTGSTMPTDGVVVVNCNAAGSVAINAGTATLNWYSGAGITAGSRTLARGGVVTLCKISSSEWEIWGSGLS